MTKEDLSLTKSKEIREKQAKILNLVKVWAVIPHPYGSQDAEGLLCMLSQEEGVVIKVERELPNVPPRCYPTHIDWRDGQKAMLKAGYVVVEPLI